MALDGTKTERTWFTSGVLAGKNRREITLLNNKIVNQNNWKYDENGNCIKIVEMGLCYNYSNNELIEKHKDFSQVVKTTTYEYMSNNLIGMGTYLNSNLNSYNELSTNGLEKILFEKCTLVFQGRKIIISCNQPK